MKLNTSILTLKIDEKVHLDANKVRGFIGNEFKEHSILHNHYGESNIYSYPLVQYKIINGDVVILAIEEGSDIINEITPQIKYLKVNKEYKIYEKILLQQVNNNKASSSENDPWGAVQSSIDKN